MPPRQRKSPQDLTGHQAQENAEKAADSAKAREAELAMATNVSLEPEDEGVIDYTGPNPVPENPVEEQPEPEPEVVGDDVVLDYTDSHAPKLDDGGNRPGKSKAKVKSDGGIAAQNAQAEQTKAELRGEAPAPVAVLAADAHDRTAVITPFDTILSMTYGLDEYGNAATRTFLAGKQYRVPLDLANHLREKKLIY